LVLPVTVKANGVEFTIQSEDDYSEIEKILDRFDDDDDWVKIFFPVTVVLADHTEIIVNNEDDLEDLTEDCADDGSDDDIECIDFNYPLQISIYDADNQVSDVITINNDKQLYDFIDDLDDDEIASFNFPLTLILSDGSELNINNHDELEDALENAIDDCDEDDDSDHNDDDIDNTELKNILMDGQWEITYFFDDEDETSDFSGYIFSFLDGGVAKARKGDLVTEGLWYANGDDGGLELELNFGENSPLDELEEDWDVVDMKENRIDLKDVGDDDEPDSILVFEKK
jgi:hypothetical protein